VKKITNKHFLITLGIIASIAFLIRIQVCNELSSADLNVANPASVTDMFTYKNLSDKILKGEFKQVFYYQPFYYAAFLPVIKHCFGNGIWAVMIVQSLLSALTVWFAGLSAKIIRDSTAGILAALLLTFSVIMILFTPYYLIATLQAFWVTLILYMSVKFAEKYKSGKEKSSWKYYSDTAILGVITGLSILTRGNIWIFVPGMVIMLILPRLQNNRYKRAILSSILFTLFLLLPQLPFVWHNTAIKGELTAPSTAAGAVLALGNTPESPPGGRDPGTGAGPMEYPEICNFWGSQAKVTPVHFQMINWFMSEPLAFSELLFRKMLLFWDYREIPNNLAIETQGLKSRTLRTIGLLPVQEVKTANGKFEFLAYNLVPMSLIILTLGLAGTIAGVIRLLSGGIKKTINRVCRHLPYYILLYFIIAYWLGTAFFYILARFRVPAIPLFAVLGSIFICRLYCFIKLSRRGSARNKRIATVSFLILLSAFLIVTFGYIFYSYRLESKIISIVRPDGVISPLENNTLMIKDNGPLSFGSWTPFELHDGQVVEKKFTIPAEKSQKNKRTFKLECYWQIPGSAILDINGKRFIINEKNRGKRSHTFILPETSNSIVKITPIKLDGKLFLFIDRQRDYGRTEINGSSPRGELVSTLYLKDKNEK